MAFTGVLTTKAEIDAYVGANVNATGNSEVNQNALVAQAEAYCASLSRYNWVTNVATLNSKYKQVLSEYCSRFAALGIIAYNMAGYTSRIEAENMINIHVFRLDELKAIIEDQKWVTKAKTA